MKKLLIIVFLLLGFSSSVYADCYGADGNWVSIEDCPISTRADGLSGRNDSATFGLDDLVKTSIEGMFDSDCGDYCITGVCAHLVVGFNWRKGFYMYTIISPQLRTTVPDLLLASYNHTGDHPFDVWQNTVEKVIDTGNTSIIATLLNAGDGLQGGHGNPVEQNVHQSLSFKEVSIIGHPASILPDIIKTDGSIGDMPEPNYQLPTIGSLSSDNLADMYENAQTGVSDIYEEAKTGINDLMTAEGEGFDLSSVYADIQTNISDAYTGFTTELSNSYQNAVNDAQQAYQQARTQIGEFDASQAYEAALADARNTYDEMATQVSDAYGEMATQVSDAYDGIKNATDGTDAPPPENENNAPPDTPPTNFNFADMYDDALAKVKQKIEGKLKTAMMALKGVETLAAIKRETEKIQELAEFYNDAMTIVETSWRGTVYGNAIKPRFRAPRIFCPTNTTPLQPYYLSYVDAFFWRSGYPITDGPISGSNHSSTILNPFSGDTLKPDPDGAEIWGHMYPREGAVNNNHDAKVGTVAAWRAMNVLVNNVKKGAGGTRFGVELETGNTFDKDLRWKKLNQSRWQMIYPEVKSCQASPAYNITDITRDFIEPNVEFGSYAWNYYNTYACCSNDKGRYLGSVTFPSPICL